LQGIDALGVATLSSATSAAASRLPFAGGPSPTSLDDEDATNLRNLYRLLLLLSKVSQKENPSPVSTIFHISQVSALSIHLCGREKKT
jgi:aarF domain-containing kinase